METVLGAPGRSTYRCRRHRGKHTFRKTIPGKRTRFLESNLRGGIEKRLRRAFCPPALPPAGNSLTGRRAPAQAPFAARLYKNRYGPETWCAQNPAFGRVAINLKDRRQYALLPMRFPSAAPNRARPHHSTSRCANHDHGGQPDWGATKSSAFRSSHQPTGNRYGASGSKDAAWLSITSFHFRCLYK